MLEVIKIKDDVILFNDEYLCSTYLINGTNKSLVIDTGFPSNNKLLEEIRKYTNNELIVCLTHGHFDHTGHLSDFDSFYMFEEDASIFDNNKDELRKAKYLKDRQVFDLGNKKIEVFKCIGHTLGSCIFVDKANKIAFTGDEFGSGCGVWMQVSQATCLSTYIQEIEKFLDYINNDDGYLLLGGHYGQEKTGRLGYNPLDVNMVRNMKELSIKLINNEVKLEDCNAKSFCNEKSYYSQYKSAEMIIRKSLIK